jgi:hypothetical protein
MDGPTPNVVRRTEVTRRRRFHTLSRAAQGALFTGVLGLFAVSCGRQDGPTPPVAVIPLTPPNFAVDDPRNGPGVCMGNDAFTAGFINGMKDATDLNCTANDIDIAEAEVRRYSINNGPLTVLNPGERISCIPTDLVFVETFAKIQNNAQSRYDIGIWIADDPTGTLNPFYEFQDGNEKFLTNALTGSCTHYNLSKTTGGVTTPGVSDLDGGDACGDMQQGAITSVKLDLLQIQCKVDNTGIVSIGACLGWQNSTDGPARVCPDPGSEATFRKGTTPETSSKCNCRPMELPIDVKSVLRVKKTTIPSPDASATSFTFTPTGWNSGNTFPLSNGQTFSSQPLSSGTYSVVETVPSGWDLTNRACYLTDAPGTPFTFTSDPPTNGVSVTLPATGVDVTCEFTNTKRGSIKIVKDAVPNDPQDFSFTATGTGMTPTPFSLDDDADGTLSNETTFSNLVAGGSRSVTEDGETGWTLTNIACTGATSSTVVIGAAGGFNAGDNSVTIGLAAGENIVCTFTNTKQGSIKIVKDAVPDNAQDFSFTASGTGMTPSPFSLDDDADGTLSNERTFSGLLPGGVRTVTEDGETGWTLTNIVCTGATSSTIVIGAAGGFNAGDNSVNVTLAAGENIVCTFTNSQLGSIKIVKDAVPNDAQDFSYTASGTGMTPSPFSLDDDADGTLSNEQLFSGLLAGGSRSVTEDGETGWTLTNIVCTGATSSTIVIGAAGGFNAGDNSVNITLAAGENIICTFTNTKQGSIRIVKDAVPNDAQDFSYTASGTGMTPSPFSLDDDADGTLANDQTFSGLLPDGVRTVTEDGETGWTLTNIVCTGATSSTIVIGAAGGFNAGDNSVNVTLAAGENIVCTFTNTKQGSIKIVKDAKNPETDAEDFSFTAGGTGMTPTSFDLDDDGEVVILSNERTFSGLLPNGARTVTEGAEANWTLTNISCTGATTSTIAYLGASGGTNAFQAGDNQVSIGLAAGENIVCTFRNERKARLIISKVVTGGGVQIFDFSRTGISNFTLQNGQTNNSGFTLAPGNYTVCELTLAVSWAATGAAGNTGGALSPVTLVNPNASDNPAQDLGTRCYTIALAYGDDKTVEITNRPPPGGNARTIGYWKNWSSCAQSNGGQFTKAVERGNYDKTLDGNLPQTIGILVLAGDGLDQDNYADDCAKAVNILDKSDLSGKKRASDAAYNLAAQLLAAKLSIQAGAGSCPAADAAISGGQALLASIGFNGVGAFLPKSTDPNYAIANGFAATLDSFNNNTLCT